MGDSNSYVAHLLLCGPAAGSFRFTVSPPARKSFIFRHLTVVNIREASIHLWGLTFTICAKEKHCVSSAW